MNAETTLNAVRELSERATLRPAAKRLRLGGPKAEASKPKRTVIPWEELHPTRMGGDPGRASAYKARKPRELVPEQTAA